MNGIEPQKKWPAKNRRNSQLVFYSWSISSIDLAVVVVAVGDI